MFKKFNILFYFKNYEGLVIVSSKIGHSLKQFYQVVGGLGYNHLCATIALPL